MVIMPILIVSLAALVGGIVAALLGWLDSGIPFEGRKFASSVLRAFVAAIAFAASYAFLGPQVTALDCAAAFLAGAGVDVLGNRLAGAIKR